MDRVPPPTEDIQRLAKNNPPRKPLKVSEEKIAPCSPSITGALNTTPAKRPNDCGEVVIRSDDLVAAIGALDLNEQSKYQNTSKEPENRLAELLRKKVVTQKRLAYISREIAGLDKSTHSVLASSAEDAALAIFAAPSELVSSFDRTPDGKLACYGLRRLLQPPLKLPWHADKAFGMLDRGPTHPVGFAMSGFSHPDRRDVLDNQAMTSKAERLRTVFGLPPDRKAASHVEAQLLAYLVSTHWPYMLEDKDDPHVQADTTPSYDIHPLITVSKPDLCPKCSELFGYFQDMFSSMDIVFHCVGDSFDVVKKLHKSRYSCGTLEGRRS